MWVLLGIIFDFLDWNMGEFNDVGGEDCMEIFKYRNCKKLKVDFDDIYIY